MCAAAEPRSRHVEEAHKQVEQALQTADQQIEALKARVSRKNAQLCETKLRLEHLREDKQEGGSSHRHAPASLPDTESSEQTGESFCCLCWLWCVLPLLGVCLDCPVKQALENVKAMACKYPLVQGLFASRCVEFMPYKR